MVDLLSPASAAAVSALASYLDGFDSGTRGRGKAYFKAGRVKLLGRAGTKVLAEVTGSRKYETLLFWEEREWYSDCSCPLGEDCKHAYATGLSWLRKCEGAAVLGGAALPAPTDIATSGKLHLQRGEEPLVAEFTAATGSEPTRPQLSFLRNLAALHRSLPQNYGWLDYSAFSNLATAADRPKLYGLGHDPFQGMWGKAPSTPLELWSFVALFFNERGITLPEFTAPFTDLDRARKSRDDIRRETALRLWQQRFTTLEQETAPPVFGDRQASIRLRIGAKKNYWEISSDGNGDKFLALSTDQLRQLLENPAAAAQMLDDPSNALLTFVRANYQLRHRTAVNLADIDDCTLLGHFFAHPLARRQVTTERGEQFVHDPRALTWEFVDHPSDPQTAIVRLAFDDGTPAPAPVCYLPGHPAFYLGTDTLYKGLPPPVDPLKPVNNNGFAAEIPRAALELPEAGRFAVRSGLKLPSKIADKFRREDLRPRLRAELTPRRPGTADEVLTVSLHALAPDGGARARWQPTGWNKESAELFRPADAAFLIHDYSALRPAIEHLARLLLLRWDPWAPGGGRYVGEIGGNNFADQFSTWLADVPAGTEIELSPELAAFAARPTRAHFTLEVSESGIDWFDVEVSLRVEDTTLTAEEIELLRQAKGRFIRLAGRGWRRLELTIAPEDSARFERLGLDPATAVDARREPPKFHALQLADEALGDALPEKLWRQIRDRASSIRQIAPPALPAGLRAEMRPYQLEGFHFLTHLAENRFGGVLADDMGLGKTLQALAWLLWLAGRAAGENRDFRALVVCPKSVVFNWETESARFAPELTTGRLASRSTTPMPAGVAVVIVNYAQLRLKAAALAEVGWDAVILDEGQNIKNPASATAQAARALKAANRIVLTGTPIENRLLDLWSLFAFAQPGLLGGQTAFKRLYNDREDPAAAHARLANRVRHFMLRRTKSQVARDLPPRMEEDIVVELDGNQRKLYEAELKRARQMLLGVQTKREFDTQRFNILQSLLRLRQICCDPRLVGAELSGSNRPARTKKTPMTEPAESETPASAKLEALLDTLEPLLAEGHRVLVFSQFVTMLELVRDELAAREIKYLMLTGQTENRQELVQQFQSPDGPPVFLLSLKAAGAGLNLTAASYVVLYDPWWNPAVEAQAIDRTHRIGQTARVIAYRLLARDTVEEKIRALQKEKATLAASVVQEESLAQVLDLDSLKHILS